MSGPLSPVLQNLIEAVRGELHRLPTDEQRAHVLELVTNDFCIYCGRILGRDKWGSRDMCHCTNDD